jgi:hypothetical protein
MGKTKPDYLSYLLRLWRADDAAPPRQGEQKDVWRASLQNTRTRNRRGFASLDELFRFLQGQTGGASRAEEDEGEER